MYVHTEKGIRKCGDDDDKQNLPVEHVYSFSSCLFIFGMHDRLSLLKGANVKYLPVGLFPPSSSRRSGIGFVHDALLQLVFELGHSAGTVMHE